MALKRGFKAEANSHSRQLRLEMGIPPYGKLCPWILAQFLEIPIHKLSELSDRIPEEVGYLLHDGREYFSAATVFVRRRRHILHNDANSPSRQASDIAHELGHAILLHAPSPPFCELGRRTYDCDIEDEASWLGFALLISEEAALHIAKSGWNYSAAAMRYGVSEQVIRMRVNMTGARRRAKSR